MTPARWRAQPRLKGQPLRVCCHAWQSSHAHSSCCQTAHPTLPLVSWASSPAQDKPFFNPFFIQQLCDFLKYQSNKTSTSHPISGSYGFPFLLKSISDSFVQPTSSAEPGPVYRFNFILRHTLTHYTSAKAAIQPVSNFFPPPYFLHAVALARNALPNKIKSPTHSSIST